MFHPKLVSNTLETKLLHPIRKSPYFCNTVQMTVPLESMTVCSTECSVAREGLALSVHYSFMLYFTFCNFLTDLYMYS